MKHLTQHEGNMSNPPKVDTDLRSPRSYSTPALIYDMRPPAGRTAGLDGLTLVTIPGTSKPLDPGMAENITRRSVLRIGTALRGNKDCFAALP